MLLAPLTLVFVGTVCGLQILSKEALAERNDQLGESLNSIMLN